MKYMMLLGGLLGFTLLFGMSLAVGESPLSSLVEASVGSVVFGLLFFWVGKIWMKNVKQMLMEKRQAAVAAMAEAEERKQREAKGRSAKTA